jgi:hypothetical protein
MKHIIVVALAATGYMSETLPTVLIQTPNGPVRINESDFDPETMKQVDAVEAPVEPEPVVISAFDPETVAAPEQLLVMKSGRKFFITNTMGVKLDGDAAEIVGIDPEGYTTEAAAQAALAALNA